MYPYTAKRRDVLGNTSPEAREFSRGRGFCTPRPSGNLSGLGGCISQYIPPLGSVRIQSHPTARIYYIVVCKLLSKPTSAQCTMRILYPYTAERRDVLGNTSPEAREISRGRGFCTPRPERLPEGEARGQSRGPRGAKSPPEGNLEGRGGCISQCIPTRGSVRPFSQH